MPSKISGNQPQQPPQNLNNLFDLKAYGYELPEDLIAQYPLANRAQARLMIINRADETIKHDVFANIGNYVPAKSVFIVNNSKVIHARLKGIKTRTQGEVEVFLLKAIDSQRFEALLKPLKRINEEEIIDFGQGITAVLENKEKRIVRFNQEDVLKKLEEIGHIPLPPYIKRQDNAHDRVDYQTVYAKQAGSVASSTAGLHFTNELITQLESQNHPFLPTTLHIGYGTFKPVEVEDIRQHPMHHETYQMEAADYNQMKAFKQEGRKVIAVGTTSCRVLETIAQKEQLSGDTNIFIYPGYAFKMVDTLITNFHLPYSTLLMLVSAFAGHALIQKAYQQAIKERYRFYSYGDAMVIV